MLTIPARSFAFARLHTGQAIKVINTNGSQVIDTWAFCIPAPGMFPAYMSMVHTRSTLPELMPSNRETFLDNRRRPMLTMLHDTSPGVHDVFFAACSPERYAQLGSAPEHDSCANILYSAVKAYGEAAFDKVVEFLECGWVPDPLNLFMNVVVKGNKLHNLRPQSKAGDYVVLQAEQDCVIFMSACPMDITDCNGGKPSSAEYHVLDDPA
ncbi:hypothetical protein H634G_04992 [Metarhizium anisopliae BRIP 53293]|uniref:DUF1989 domain-containing protein n=1 Tax=Metarhizium anisopliae BRIP 53293 TaxID=1291518 RepID=A0A0D9NZY1_METAN|nr:hypothetical protein H634G_04992 [Metarhizium anisopliae BRIP 53293]KJK87419.1 hypothetical protein H633G_08714 [Metarhizium anisopliae BRIP 53284]